MYVDIDTLARVIVVVDTIGGGGNALVNDVKLTRRIELGRVWGGEVSEVTVRAKPTVMVVVLSRKGPRNSRIVRESQFLVRKRWNVTANASENLALSKNFPRKIVAYMARVENIFVI